MNFEFRSAEDVAEILGIELDTLYRYARKGRIRGLKVGKAWRFASMSGKSASVPSGNHLACAPMKLRGMSHGPRCDPATNSKVDSRRTGSTGIQKLTFWFPAML